MKLSEILTGPETWIKAACVSLDMTQRCLVFAVERLGCLEGLDLAGVEREHGRLRRLVGSDVMIWNDAPERTWDEVADVVDAYDRDRLLNP